MEFVGRERELALLERELDFVRRGGSRPGRCLLLRGRRRVGKSRLVEVFAERSGVPSLFFTASGSTPVAELVEFRREVLASDLPRRELFDGVALETWEAALRLLAAALPEDAPAIVVIDELPYLTAADPGFEGVLQRVWDRVLVRRPVLLVLVGSDLSMMTALNEHGRPFHQRGVPMVLDPLTPAEVGDMLALDPADAIDSYLVTGGLPLVCAEWSTGMTRADFLRAALAAPTSALVVSAELSLAAEFPVDTQPRTVLTAIGTGERTFTTIQRATGLPAASLNRALDLLTRKQIVVAELPLSTAASRERRYRVADPYLRFWLHFLGPRVSEVDRGRGDRVLARIEEGWASWRGRAVEPIVREALLRLSASAAVGGYWTRTNDVEVDIVGADHDPVARRIDFVGSIKWHESRAFDGHELASLIRGRSRVPGTDERTPLVAVSRAGVRTEGLTASYGPGDLLAAWQP
ncbi:MAG: ATP-binding protein [Pseudonocardiaceae bacterium]